MCNKILPQVFFVEDQLFFPKDLFVLLVAGCLGGLEEQK